MGRLVRRYIRAYKLSVLAGGLELTGKVSNTITLTAAENAQALTVVDSGVLATGTSRSLYIESSNTGAKTVNATVTGLGIVMSLAAAASIVIGEHIHLHNTGNLLTGNYTGLFIDVDDPGTGCSNFMLMDLYRDNTHTGASRDCYIRCKSGGTVLGKHVFYIEGTSNIMTDALFGFLGCEGTSFLKGGACTGTIAYAIKVLVHSIAGDAGVAHYIPLYPTAP